MGTSVQVRCLAGCRVFRIECVRRRRGRHWWGYISSVRHRGMQVPVGDGRRERRTLQGIRNRRRCRSGAGGAGAGECGDGGGRDLILRAGPAHFLRLGMRLLGMPFQRPSWKGRSGG